MARRPDVIMMLACLVLVGALAMVAVQFLESKTIVMSDVQTMFTLTDNFYVKLR
jgi:hypothetical protein